MSAPRRSPNSSSWTCIPTSCAMTRASRASCACVRPSARPSGTRRWSGKPQTIDDLKFANYFKEIFLDSDTKVACISGAPSDVPEDWFLTNEMKAEARAKVNQEAGTRRMLAHAIFTPGQPGWLEQVDRAIAELKPDSFKGYTIGDNTHKELSKYPWRMDDEKLVYPFYEKCLKAGLVNICVHKGLFPPSIAEKFPHLLAHSDVRDVGKAARDWPQLNFIIYHSGYRFGGGRRKKRGRNSRKPGVSNGSAIWLRFQRNTVSPMSTAISGKSLPSRRWPIRTVRRHDGHPDPGAWGRHVCWGTDAIWTGSPQWQIEALRRLEIPEDMQKHYGFQPLGDADGPVKTAILGGNNARLYKYPMQQKAELCYDRFAQFRESYEQSGRPQQPDVRLHSSSDLRKASCPGVFFQNEVGGRCVRQKVGWAQAPTTDDTPPEVNKHINQLCAKIGLEAYQLTRAVLSPGVRICPPLLGCLSPDRYHRGRRPSSHVQNHDNQSGPVLRLSLQHTDAGRWVIHAPLADVEDPVCVDRDIHRLLDVGPDGDRLSLRSTRSGCGGFPGHRHRRAPHAPADCGAGGTDSGRFCQAPPRSVSDGHRARSDAPARCDTRRRHISHPAGSGTSSEG